MNKKSHFQTDLESFFKITGKWILCIRSQQIARADIVFSDCINQLERLLDYGEMTALKSLLLDNFECLLAAYENRDYILCADYMEKGIVDVLKKEITEWMPEWGGFPDYEEYRLEYTETVSVTVAKKIKNQWRYLHSNCDPWKEAFLWSERQLEAGIEKYHIVGLGLGYHTCFLAENPLVHVVVYEEDRKMIEIYQNNIGNPRKNIELVYDPGYIKFYDVSCSIDKKREKLCLYYPSIQTIKDVELKQKMKRLFLQIDNAKYWENNFAINFAYNSTHINEGIENLKKNLFGKKVYLIAGGPSLDKNIKLLKKREKDSIVMTVGTSFRKCTLEDIHPDYVIITDPKPYVHKQIEGMENSTVPMILLSTAFAQVARDYKGKKYILYQKGFDMAEHYAKEKKCQLVETGGSVATTALYLCICCQVKKVVFLGLDLAFTGGKTHHEIAVEDEIGEATIKIPDIYGNLVGTAENLNQYRIWIENCIARAQKDSCKIEFVDATEGGARIQGTKICRLCDEIKEAAENE